MNSIRLYAHCTNIQPITDNILESFRAKTQLEKDKTYGVAKIFCLPVNVFLVTAIKFLNYVSYK